MPGCATQDCAYFAGDNCTEQERYPGLWEFPLLNTQAESECCQRSCQCKSVLVVGTLEVFVRPLRAGVAHYYTQAAALYTACRF